MKTYRLAGDYPLKFDGTEYQEGDPVEMDDDTAAPLVASGRLVEITDADADDTGDTGDGDGGGSKLKAWLKRLAGGPKAPPEGDERRGLIEDVIKTLNPKDVAHFTQGGKPDANVLADLLNFDVSAAERDEIWAEMQAGKNS